jgi:hypothetical protein
MEAIATRLVERLRAAGHEAFFAGGCVRDMLLGKEAHDIDIATSAKPVEVQALFLRTVAVGAAFGVIVVLEEGLEFQVATFRCDGNYKDGRHPESVSFTTAEGMRDDAILRLMGFSTTLWKSASSTLSVGSPTSRLAYCAPSETPWSDSPRINSDSSAV